jgi:hypothetical protein
LCAKKCGNDRDKEAERREDEGEGEKKRERETYTFIGGNKVSLDNRVHVVIRIGAGPFLLRYLFKRFLYVHLMEKGRREEGEGGGGAEGGERARDFQC